MDYLLFRYGFVDGLSQRLSLSEEKFLELLTAFDSMHAGFDQSEEEAEEISEIISKSEKSNTYPDLVMIGGKSAIAFDKGCEIDELIDIMKEIGSVIDSKINLPIESQSRVKSIDTQIPSDYREYNEVGNTSRSIEERLIAIKELLEKGLITEDQANQKRESLLEEL